jgi:multidrug resistance efflux pump
MVKGTMEKDIELRSEDVQDVMGNMPPAILRWGISVIALVVVCLLIGCFYFKYPDKISGKIVLTTEVPPANILARATGKIDKVYVANNQRVHAGAVLGVIQNPASTTDIQLLNSRLKGWNSDAPNASIARKLLDNKPLELGSIQLAYTNFQQALTSYLRFETMQYHPRKLHLQERKVSELEVNLDEMKRRSVLLQQQVESAQEIWKRDSMLNRKGLMSDEEYELSRNKMLQSQQDYSALLSEIKLAEMDINTSQGSLLDLRKDYVDNESIYLLQLRTATEQLQTELKSWERNYLLVSPIDGTVNLMGYWSNNQNVNMGEIVFSVVPTIQTLPVCKMLLPAQGSGKVLVGQLANVRLNNFPDQEFGYLEGRVEHISDTPDPDGMYVVEIRFPKGLVTNYGIQLPITRQMQGNADIITEDIRLIVRFFNPIKILLKKYT